MRKSDMFILLFFGICIVLWILLTVSTNTKTTWKPSPTPTIKLKPTSTPTPTPTMPFFIRGFQSVPASGGSSGTISPQGQQAAPQQTQVQEIHNDGTSSQTQSPGSGPTPTPGPTPICFPIVGCL